MCDDDAGQMRKVGKFIMEDDNTATISPMNSTTNKKSVSFALQIDEEEDNNSLVNVRRSNNNSENEHNAKSIPELIDIISKLQIDLSAETSMRKKKDKSLLKLAKQLASQAEDIEEMEQHINDLHKEISNLEKSNQNQREINDALMLQCCNSKKEPTEENHDNLQHATLLKWDEQWETKLQQLIASAVGNAESENRKQIISDQVIHKFQSTTTSEQFFLSFSKLQLITIFICMMLHFFAMFFVFQNFSKNHGSPTICPK